MLLKQQTTNNKQQATNKQQTTNNTQASEGRFIKEKTSIAPLTFSIAPATFRWHL
jgi:hypothetical protein